MATLRDCALLSRDPGSPAFAPVCLRATQTSAAARGARRHTRDGHGSGDGTVPQLSIAAVAGVGACRSVCQARAAVRLARIRLLLVEGRLPGVP